MIAEIKNYNKRIGIKSKYIKAKIKITNCWKYEKKNVVGSQTQFKKLHQTRSSIKKEQQQQKQIGRGENYQRNNQE